MAEQKTILRVFRLIRLLMQTPARTIPELAKRVEVTPRTLYRYIGLLNELGYPVENDFENRYFISNSFGGEVKNNFGQEEAGLIQDLLLTSAAEHPLKDSILKKLYLHSNLKPLAENLLRIHTGALVETLSLAIREKKQVMLRNYHSAQSRTTSDRKVEPLLFTENYTRLSAFEPASGKEKIFKLERIESVELLPTDRIYRIPAAEPDAFGMMEEGEIPVLLRLTDRAYQLMQEEYPMLKPYLYKKDNHYYFDGTVKSVIGIGRFVLGLCTEIQVISPDVLKDYLNERVKNLRF